MTAWQRRRWQFCNPFDFYRGNDFSRREPQKSQTSIKKPSRSLSSRVCVLKLYFSFVFVFIRGELKCCNPPPPDCRSSDSTWGGRSSLWFWEQPSEAALGSVVVTDLNRANLGGRLFPYGSLFSSTLGRLGSENLLPLLSSPTSSVQCEAVTQLRDKFCKPGYFNHHNLTFKLYSFFKSAAFLYFI